MKDLLKNSLIILLESLMLCSLFVLNVAGEENNVVDIYLRPGQTTYREVDGDLNLGDFDSNVATIETKILSGGDNIAQLGVNGLYDGEIINLSDALYTFNLIDDPDTVKDESLTSYGKKYSIKADNGMYLIADGDINNYHSISYREVELRKFTPNDSSNIEFGLVGQNSRCLYFEFLKSKNMLHLDHWAMYATPEAAKVSLLFHIYKYSEVNGKPTYTPLTDYPVNGDKCLIVAEVANDNHEIYNDFKYVIYPNENVGCGPYKQVAKWHFNQTKDAITELKITAKNNASASNFTVTKDSIITTYRVHIADVPNKIENADVFVFGDTTDQVNKVTMMVGTQYKLNVTDNNKVLYWISSDDEIATVSDGVINAVGTKNNIFEKIYVGYIEKDTYKKHSIEVVVINQAFDGPKKQVDTYLKIEDNRTTVSYAWILNKDFSEVRQTWPNNELKDAISGEVNVGESTLGEQYALVFFAKTTGDRLFDVGDVKVDGVNTTLTNVSQFIEEYEQSNVVKDVYNQNLYKLMKTAQSNGYTVSLIFKSEGDADLVKNIHFNSSYYIKVIKSNDSNYAHQDESHILKDVTPNNISDEFKAQFDLKEEDLAKSIFKEYKIFRGSGSIETEVENAELLKDILVDIDVSELLNYESSKIKSRKFKVLSKHMDQIIDWGTYTQTDGLIRAKINKFSPFAIISVDEYYPTSSNNNKNELYRAPNTCAK